MREDMNMSKKDIFILAALIALCESVGFVGSLFTSPAIPVWYASLIKPSFTPPSWIFAPVWTALYAMMGVSLFLILRQRSSFRIRGAVISFSAQLFLNLLWSPAFFGMRSPLLGFIVIIPLLIAIALTIAIFHPISRKAAYLLIPYLAWVAFASMLNYSIMRLN